MLVLIAAALVALAGTVAATQDRPSLSPTALGYRQLAEKDIRLATIGYILARANAPFCKLTSANPGWVLHDSAQYGDAAAAREAFAFHAPVAVLAVVEGGPAARAGIDAGDGLVARDGTRWVWTDQRRVSADRLETVRAELAAHLGDGISLELATTKGARTVRLRPAAICKSDFWVDARAKKDAGADGERVRVTSGLIDYVRDDDELAAIVAHEMAHNILGHRARIKTAKSGRTRLTKATEEEADRLSVWLMANAGYDVEAAVAFWERYGRATDLGIFTAPTHDRWQNRIAALRIEIAAIAEMPSSGTPRDPPLLRAHRMSR